MSEEIQTKSEFVVPKIDKNSVTQSNHLISAAYSLPLNAKRLLMLSLSKINPNVWTQDWEIDVHASEWNAVFGRQLKHCYSDMENASDELMDAMITLRTGPDTKKAKGKVEKGRWVSWAKYYPGEARVRLEIPKGLRKYLAFAMLEEQGFTSYKILGAGKLRSPNSIRMYEFLMQWKKTGLLIIEVEELRERLELGEKYKLFSDLRKWCINPSIDDINKNSDYVASWETYTKKGRKVVTLKFTFEKKSQQSFDFDSSALNNLKVQ